MAKVAEAPRAAAAPAEILDATSTDHVKTNRCCRGGKRGAKAGAGQRKAADAAKETGGLKTDDTQATDKREAKAETSDKATGGEGLTQIVLTRYIPACSKACFIVRYIATCLLYTSDAADE